MTTKDKNWRYESWAANRPSISKEEKRKILKKFYDKQPLAASSGRLLASSRRLASTNAEPHYSDEYLDLMVP